MNEDLRNLIFKVIIKNPEEVLECFKNELLFTLSEASELTRKELMSKLNIVTLGEAIRFTREAKYLSGHQVHETTPSVVNFTASHQFNEEGPSLAESMQHLSEEEVVEIRTSPAPILKYSTVENISSLFDDSPDFLLKIKDTNYDFSTYSDDISRLVRAGVDDLIKHRGLYPSTEAKQSLAQSIYQLAPILGKPVRL